jgi:hypothetical protein
VRRSDWSAGIVSQWVPVRSFSASWRAAIEDCNENGVLVLWWVVYFVGDGEETRLQ